MSEQLNSPALDWPGATSVRARAIEHVVRAVAAKAAGLPVGDVAVALADRHGGLRLDLVLPLVLTPVGSSLPERATAICTQVAHRTAELTGRTVGEVDLRFASVRRPEERRVR